MNIRRRGDSFQIRVPNGVDHTGKRLTETTTYSPEWYTKTGKRRSDAAVQKEVEAFARDFERRVKEGRYSSVGKLTFQQFAIRWRDEWAISHLSESVVQTNWKILERRAFPAFGGRSIESLRPLDMQALINSMQEAGLKPATVKRQFYVISSVFDFAERMEVVQDNPCRKVELPTIKKENELHYFTVKQAKIFLHELEKPYKSYYSGHDRVSQAGKDYQVAAYTEEHYIPIQWQSYFTLAIYGGFRRGELCALRWCDIDFEHNIINITRSAAKVTGKTIIKDPKTAAGSRSLTLPKEVFTKLRVWRKAQKELSLKLGSAWIGEIGRNYDKNFVFIQLDSGKMVDISTPSHIFKKVIERYNSSCVSEDEKLPVIRLHDLRHTTATLLIDAGVPITEISRRLGHSKTSITLDIYGHALPHLDSAASDIIEDLFSDDAAANNL